MDQEMSEYLSYVQEMFEAERRETYLSRITPEAAAHYLYMNGVSGGREPGSFTSTLFELIRRADVSNLAKLSEAFPEEVAAYRLATLYQDGVEVLQDIASRLP